MIQASSAITYIQDELNQLKSSGRLYGRIRRSKTTLSLYLNTKKPTPDPQKNGENFQPSSENAAYGSRVKPTVEYRKHRY